MGDSNKVAKLILGILVSLLVVWTTYSILRRNTLLQSNEIGYVRVLKAEVGRQGKTNRVLYLELSIVTRDSVLQAHRKVGEFAAIEVGDCYRMKYAVEDPTVFDVDYSTPVKCPIQDN